MGEHADLAGAIVDVQVRRERLADRPDLYRAGRRAHRLEEPQRGRRPGGWAGEKLPDLRRDRGQAGDAGLLDQGGKPGAQTSNIVKINPETLAVREVIREPTTPAFGAGTVAVEVGNQIWVGSFRGDRIAIFPANR